MLNQKQLGQELGLSPAMITKLKGQGMPVNSVNAAGEWRARNKRAYVDKTDPVKDEVRLSQARSETFAR